MNRFTTLVIVGAISLLVPSAARADTYLYSVSGFRDVVTFTFQENSLSPSGSVTGTDLLSITGVPTGFSSFVFTWNSGDGVTDSRCPLAPGQGYLLATAPYSCADFGFFDPTLNGIYSINGDAFAPGSFLTPGTYVGIDNLSTVTITAVPTPEPSSLILLGTGALALFGPIRRRFLHRRRIRV